MCDLAKSVFRLTKILSPHARTAHPTHVVRGKRRYHLLNAGKPRIYLIDEGVFLIRKTKDNKIVSVISSPTIVGWSIAMIDQDIIYLEKVDYGKIRWMPLDVAMRIVTAYQRFDDVLKIVNFRFQLLVNHCVDNSGDSISVVEKTLRSLNQLPPDVRQRFTALTYLSQYTSLSKSTINRVLKRLQHDGMIALDRGRLIQFSDIRTDEQT
ncbi:hypothetical protein BIY29_00915 [Brenneria alni]|uniref:IprA winged helix-turn-helix domain-containing protein n=2 Tax=Brenneria alni TaxID=71656 RepID=A0A421DU50_9GAMM|nr:hypothetical protein BIY29_00915 [Brenneria alni]